MATADENALIRLKISGIISTFFLSESLLDKSRTGCDLCTVRYHFSSINFIQCSVKCILICSRK